MILNIPVKCIGCGERATWRIVMRRGLVIHRRPNKKCLCLKPKYTNGVFTFGPDHGNLHKEISN